MELTCCMLLGASPSRPQPPTTGQTIPHAHINTHNQRNCIGPVRLGVVPTLRNGGSLLDAWVWPHLNLPLVLGGAQLGLFDLCRRVCGTRRCDHRKLFTARLRSVHPRCEKQARDTTCRSYGRSSCDSNTVVGGCSAVIGKL